MANQNQLGGVAVVGGDRPYRNVTGTDIAAGLVVIFDASNPEALHLAPAVKLPTAGATGVTKQAGVTIDKLVTSGAPGRVRVMGSAVTTANGTIATGQKVCISSTALKLGWVRVAAAGD